MDAVLDTIWEYLVAGFILLGDTMFSMMQHLHFLGPVFIISLLGLCTVSLTKLLNRFIITKRYLELEKTYTHWMKIRQEAMDCEDTVKGSRMARNIDKAELNKAYYDYFFEGFLLGIARKVLPIFFIFAFINEYYRPEKMLSIFGREYVIQISSINGEPVLIGTVFWYFISLLSGYLLWSITGALLKKYNTEKTSPMIAMVEEIRT